MAERVRAFLDTSALFAAVWSDQGGARMILKLGEAGAVALLVSPQVIKEAEGALKRKAPETLPLLAILLDRGGVTVEGAAPHKSAAALASVTGHPGDAQIVADALQAKADYLITLDREHLLGNALLAGAVQLPIGTPGDFLAWFRGRFAGNPG
jgi:predicted nucleic acid-binding protein